MTSYDHLWDNSRGVCRRCGGISSEVTGPCETNPSRQARIVREAIWSLRHEPHASLAVHAFIQVPDETLIKLGRLLKS